MRIPIWLLVVRLTHTFADLWSFAYFYHSLLLTYDLWSSFWFSVIRDCLFQELFISLIFVSHYSRFCSLIKSSKLFHEKSSLPRGYHNAPIPPSPVAYTSRHLKLMNSSLDGWEKEGLPRTCFSTARGCFHCLGMRQCRWSQYWWECMRSFLCPLGRHWYHVYLDSCWVYCLVLKKAQNTQIGIFLFPYSLIYLCISLFIHLLLPFFLCSSVHLSIPSFICLFIFFLLSFLSCNAYTRVLLHTSLVFSVSKFFFNLHSSAAQSFLILIYFAYPN